MAEELSRYVEDEELKLIDVTSIFGSAVFAKDRMLGTVQDLLLDDKDWQIRFLVVSTPEWLPGKKVLVSPLDLDFADWGEQKLIVTAGEKQLREHAALGEDDPVTRGFELQLFRHLKWPPYWAESEPDDRPKTTVGREDAGKPDLHLFSTRELLEFRLMTFDGDAGQIAGFIVDEEDWGVYYLIIETGNLDNARRVLISSDWLDRIGRDEGLVYSDLTVRQVRGAPEYNPAVPITRDVELEIYDYYGRPHYWVQGDVVEDSDDVGQGTQGD